MHGSLPIQYLEVEFEEVDGKRILKKLPDGTNPITAYGHMLIEMDREHRKNNNDWPLVEVSVLEAKGEYGEPPHYEATVFSLENGEREPISRVIIIDKATGKPAVKLTPKEKGYIPKSQGLVHLEQMLTHEKLKEQAKKRGLQIRSESIEQLDKVVQGLEGKV